MLTMYQQITIKTLAQQHKKNVEIADAIGCHRNTVRNVIKRVGVVEKATRDKPSYYDQYHEQIQVWVDKKVSHVRMYELLQETYTIERSYDSLCKYIQREFPNVSEAFGVQVTQAGEVAEVDFGYAGLQPINAPGEPLKTAKTWYLTVRLSYSHNAYRELTHDQKVTTFITGITHACEFFGGVPKHLKIDNLRAAVIKNQHYDLQFNPDFLAWANHYSIVITACTPYHPEQKGGVESDVKYIAHNFLVERHFTDWVDLKQQFHSWSTAYANGRVHGITKQVPSQVFEDQEKHTLQPLPATPFASFERYERKVHTNCHIFLHNHYYSVPAKLVGQMVTVRLGDNLIKVLHKGAEVACHLQSTETGGYSTSRSHLPEYKCYGETEYQQKYESKMADLGESAHEYFKQILVKHDSYWFRSVRTILGLAHEYGAEAVNLSLARALAYQVTDIAVIKRIVTQQLYRLGSAPRLLAGSTITSKEPVETNTTPSTFLDQILARIGQRPAVVPTAKSFTPGGETCSTSNLDRDLGYYQQLLEGTP